jgi:hypothetical protein
MNIIKPAVAGETLTGQQYRAVYADSADSHKVKVHKNTAPENRPCGILTREGADDAIVDVCFGGVCKAEIGTAGAAPHALLSTDASGRLETAAKGEWAIARLLQALRAGAIRANATVGELRDVEVFAQPFIVGGGLTATKTHDFGSINSLATATTTQTVAGAAAGDTVIVEANSLEPGLTVAGEVTAANTVTITVTNHSAGAIDPASQDFVITVIPDNV